jgi:putative glutamine amidotransferase
MNPRIVVPFWEERWLGDYAAQLRCQDAEVVALPAQERWTAADARAALAGAHGLMLIGGGDVGPARYGATDAAGRCRHVEPRRDELELAALAWALRRDLPTLALCRGHQALAVACGGVLVMDVPTQVPGCLRHGCPRDELDAHRVDVVPGSRLAAILGPGPLVVNSRHHQAVDPARVGAGLTVSARAPDGVIEALESERHGFVLGVQWHPENFPGPAGRFAPLFRAFVAHAAGRAAPGSAP